MDLSTGLAPAEPVGARIARLRKARGLTQAGLALRANVSYSLVTKVETGHRPASAAFIGAVAQAMRADQAEVTGASFSLVPGSALLARHQGHARDLLGCQARGGRHTAGALLIRLACDPAVNPWLLIDQLMAIAPVIPWT